MAQAAAHTRHSPPTLLKLPHRAGLPDSHQLSPHGASPAPPQQWSAWLPPHWRAQNKRPPDKDRSTKAKVAPAHEHTLRSHPDSKRVEAEAYLLQPGRVSPKGFCKCDTPSRVREGVSRWRICVLEGQDQVSLKHSKRGPRISP